VHGKNPQPEEIFRFASCQKPIAAAQRFLLYLCAPSILEASKEAVDLSRCGMGGAIAFLVGGFAAHPLESFDHKPDFPASIGIGGGPHIRTAG
jgi:hypothetical protein